MQLAIAHLVADIHQLLFGTAFNEDIDIVELLIVVVIDIDVPTLHFLFLVQTALNG